MLLASAQSSEPSAAIRASLKILICFSTTCSARSSSLVASASSRIFSPIKSDMSDKRLKLLEESEVLNLVSKSVMLAAIINTLISSILELIDSISPV